MIVVTDAEKWKEFNIVEYPSKTWEETDVEIAITHCGCVTHVWIPP